MSVKLSTLPSPFVSVPPASTKSGIPSLSESKSKWSSIPSLSVSLNGSPFCSTVSGIPSLSSSKSTESIIPSPSLSGWTVIVTLPTLDSKPLLSFTV